MEKSTILKLFGYNKYVAEGLETREAMELYELIKRRMDVISRRESINNGQNLKKLNMPGLPKANDHGDHYDHRRRFYGEIEEIEVEAETNFRNFKNFTVLEFPPSDHHFLCLKNGAKLFGGSSNRSLRNKICKEWDKICKDQWEILEAKLPGSIFYIRVYKSRFDLMRVAMIDEKATTSYHHGLFFFDIFFPRDYPSKPPKLYYHSYGELHPNFHQGGEVSGYLFKNWRRWIQSNEESPIINLLVLIQQSVSILSPNFNVEEKRMMSCFKNFMMQANGAILYMLRSPPEGFEVFVTGYFLMRAHYILLNYKTFYKTLMINPDDKDNDNPPEKDLTLINPDGKDLYRLFFKLVRVLEANGAYCKHHYNKQQYDQKLLEETRIAELTICEIGDFGMNFS